MAYSMAALWPNWSKDAACAGRDTEDFFPESRKTIAEEVEASWPALRVCHSCPVRAECLERSFEMGDDHGVFGGATPSQRRLVEHDVDRVAILLFELDLEMAWVNDREAVSA
jgi:WhiB family redox-sensing transcriptional regulator